MKSCSPAFLFAMLLFVANALQPQHLESFLYLNGTSKASEKPSESTAEPAETTEKPSESTAEPAETTEKPSESTAEPAETTQKPSESTAEPAETTHKPSESTAEPAETTEQPSESTSEPAKNFFFSYGKDACPCVGIDDIEGESNIKLQDGTLVKYPADVGSSCEAWEESTHPKCSNDKDAPSWCKNRWCYVDPCNCDLQILPKMTESNVTYRGRRAYWSYNTCGGKDEYSKTLKFACVNLQSEEQCVKHDKCAWNGKQCGGKEIMKTCKETKNDTQIYGEEDCRCVGLSGKNGTAKFTLNETHKIDYPSDAGAYCKAWEGEVYPECKREGEKPHFCEMKWCWVDPCTCKTKVPPKATTEDFKFQGVTAHWSYTTCGNDGKWSADAAIKEDYCGDQESESDCCKLGAKCGWTGKKCMTRELATTCPGNDPKDVKECGSKSGTHRTRCAVTSVLMLGVFAML